MFAWLVVCIDEIKPCTDLPHKPVSALTYAGKHFSSEHVNNPG